MRLAELDTTPKASAHMLDACAPCVSPEDMLRSVVAILERQIPFDLVSYTEYHHGAEAAKGTTLVRGRFATDGGIEFQCPRAGSKYLKISRAGFACHSASSRSTLRDFL